MLGILGSEDLISKADQTTRYNLVGGERGPRWSRTRHRGLRSPLLVSDLATAYLLVEISNPKSLRCKGDGALPSSVSPSKTFTGIHMFSKILLKVHPCMDSCLFMNTECVLNFVRGTLFLHCSTLPDRQVNAMDADHRCEIHLNQVACSRLMQLIFAEP